MQIIYKFTLSEGHVEEFVLNLNGVTLQPLFVYESIPEWTELDFFKCQNCPLKSSDHPYCPVALTISNIIEKFSKMISYKKTHLEVVTAERTISSETTIQRALSSLLGLLMAVSGCPHTRFLKPMARFHLPLGNEEETIYRATSMHLLRLYFEQQGAESSNYDFSGLDKLYKELNIVNKDFCKRLREATEEDASVNAVVLLDLYARAVPFVIEDSLEELSYLFRG